MKEHEENFGELLHRYRTREGLTQQGLAEKASVRRTTIAGWENSIYMPTRDAILRVAQALSLSNEEQKALLLAGLIPPGPSVNTAQALQNAVERVAEANPKISKKLPQHKQKLLILTISTAWSNPERASFGP